MGEYVSQTPNGKVEQAITNGVGHKEELENEVSSSVLYQQIKQPIPKIISAKGNYLTTDTGKEIFDASGGAAVACIGHGNARVKDAIVRQLDQVAYTYLPFFTTEPAEKLAKELVDSTGGEMTKVFIVSSGTACQKSLCGNEETDANNW